jgi:hypothetical protein
MKFQECKLPAFHARAVVKVRMLYAISEFSCPSLSFGAAQTEFGTSPFVRDWRTLSIHLIFSCQLLVKVYISAKLSVKVN